MKKFYAISIFLIISIFTFGQKTWTGAIDNDYSKPANWNPNGVPDYSDNVVIPSGTPTCELPTEVRVESLTNNGTLSTLDNYNIVANQIVNTGTMNIKGMLTIFGKNKASEPSFINTEGGVIQSHDEGYESILCFVVTEDAFSVEKDAMDFINNGIIKVSSFLGLFDEFDNETGGNIECDNLSDESGNHILIEGNSISNGGNITGGDDKGVDLSFICKYSFFNNGTIQGGNVIDHPSAYLWKGGNIEIQSGWVMNKGIIRGGTGGQDAAGGKVMINGNSILTDEGTIEAGYSEGGYKAIVPSNVTLSADSVVIDLGDNMISGFDINISAKEIVITNLNGYASIISENNLSLYTTPGGTIDLSGVHVTGAIFSLGSINMYSDNIIPPTEGLGEVCEPNPVTAEADESFIAGHVQPFTVMAPHNSSGSIQVYLCNNSSVNQVLTCDISSELDWVSTHQTNTSTIESFVLDSIDIDYTIPALTEDTVDVVRFILSINETVIDTTYSYIRSFSSSTNIPQNTWEFTKIYPNPFKNCFTICFDQDSDYAIEVLNKAGQIVFNQDCNKNKNKIFLGDELSSGVYFVRIISDEGVYRSKIVKI